MSNDHEMNIKAGSNFTWGGQGHPTPPESPPLWRHPPPPQQVGSDGSTSRDALEEGVGEIGFPGGGGGGNH